MNSKDDSDDKRNEEGRDRAVVLRHDAKEGDLINRRVWLTKAEVPEFDRRIALLGAHILGIAAALDHHGLRPLKRRRPAASKPKDGTPTSGSTPEPKPADASQIMKAEPAAPPAPAAAPEPVDARQPIKLKKSDPDKQQHKLPGFL